jgi:hypothetical protein
MLILVEVPIAPIQVYGERLLDAHTISESCLTQSSAASNCSHSDKTMFTPAASSDKDQRKCIHNDQVLEELTQSSYSHLVL